MNNKIYWYCFKRQCREFYDLLTLYKLISCDIDMFMSRFTGKKFYDEDILPGDIIKWQGSEKLLIETFLYLAEKGFIDDETFTSSSIEKHFNCSNLLSIKSKKYFASLKALFPETTGYRCKTRLYYKERNKKHFKVAGLIYVNPGDI